MIVADTSALVSLATAETLELVLAEFDVHTTQTVVDELSETAEYDDAHGSAAQAALNMQDRITIHTISGEVVTSSRIDAGEGSCCTLAANSDADFVLTDDLRALPELQQVTEAKVAISPIVLQALVKRDVLDRADAIERLEHLAETRDWLGAPIYRRARQLFED